METIIITSLTDLEKIIESIIDRKFFKSENIENTYTINQVAKMMKRSHKRISDLVASGILKTTKDNRIYESSLKEFIQKQ